MQHQPFSDTKAEQQKLAALRLPPLADKRFLDVGCGEGYFCGYALFDGASRVVGIDTCAEDIDKAAAHFPDAEFINCSWDTLPKKPFDVITVLSTLHYAEDQEALIHRLMKLLADNGLLVLEIDIAAGSQDKWSKLLSSTKEYYFPTRSALRRVLKKYAWKIIHDDIVGLEDQQRIILHIRKLQPYAWLLIQNPGMGKSTISRRLFNNKSGIPVISGDRIYMEITEGKFKISKNLRQQVTEGFSTATIDKTTRKIFEKGLADELVQLWTNKVGFKDFAIDSYIPKEYRPEIKELLKEKGYFPVDFSWDNPTPLTKAQVAVNKTKQYVASLKKQQADLGNKSVIITKIINRKYKPLIQWHLDSPNNGDNITDAQTIQITGWAITKEHLQSSYTLYATSSDNKMSFSPVKMREDVLHALFGSTANAADIWQSTPCGFSFELPAKWLASGIELGLEIKGSQIPLARIALSQSKTTSLSTQLVQGLKRLRG